jgi:drug/metabolite transporter (DMT)-like permease
MYMDITAISTTAIVFSAPILIVFIVLLMQLKREQSRHQLIGKALELGKEIDPALLAVPVKERKRNSNRLLIWGVLLVCVGLAAFGSLALSEDLEEASMSALLVFPGIGLLVVYALTRKTKALQAAE